MNSELPITLSSMSSYLTRKQRSFLQPQAYVRLLRLVLYSLRLCIPALKRKSVACENIIVKNRCYFSFFNKLGLSQLGFFRRSCIFSFFFFLPISCFHKVVFKLDYFVVFLVYLDIDERFSLISSTDVWKMCTEGKNHLEKKEEIKSEIIFSFVPILSLKVCTLLFKNCTS